MRVCLLESWRLGVEAGIGHGYGLVEHCSSLFRCRVCYARSVGLNSTMSFVTIGQVILIFLYGRRNITQHDSLKMESRLFNYLNSVMQSLFRPAQR